MEKTVLSKEEINNLSSLQQQQDTFIIQLGQIEYQKNMLPPRQIRSRWREKGVERKYEGSSVVRATQNGRGGSKSTYEK